MPKTAENDHKARPAVRLLVDTCVWLDLAKDHSQQHLLAALEDLVKVGEVELVVPRTVLEEFAANKDRIVEEAGRSFSGALRRAREAVDKFGDPKRKNKAITDIDEVVRRVGNLADDAVEGVTRIQKLFATASVIETADEVKLRATDRAIKKLAPFHRQRNGINDAILIETYAKLLTSSVPRQRFAFITHNVKDFSHPTGNQKLPHPDIAALFSRIRSRYFITLGAALKSLRPDELSDLMIEHEPMDFPPRRLSEIWAAEAEYDKKVWHNRHMVRREKIEAGEIKIVEKETYPKTDWRERTIQRDIWEGALAAAKRVRKELGRGNHGPWDDFEWGMVNGKLSALRWVLGEDWDMLDT
jgi:hypothetical protein